MITDLHNVAYWPSPLVFLFAPIKVFSDISVHDLVTDFEQIFICLGLPVVSLMIFLWHGTLRLLPYRVW